MNGPATMRARGPQLGRGEPHAELKRGAFPACWSATARFLAVLQVVEPIMHALHLPT